MKQRGGGGGSSPFFFKYIILLKKTYRKIKVKAIWPVHAFLTALYNYLQCITFTYNYAIFIIFIFKPTVTGDYDSTNHHNCRLERVCVHHRSQSTLISREIIHKAISPR